MNWAEFPNNDDKLIKSYRKWPLTTFDSTSYFGLIKSDILKFVAFVLFRLDWNNVRTWERPDYLYYVLVRKSLELTEGVFSFSHDCIVCRPPLVLLQVGAFEMETWYSPFLPDFTEVDFLFSVGGPCSLFMIIKWYTSRFLCGFLRRTAANNQMRRP